MDKWLLLKVPLETILCPLKWHSILWFIGIESDNNFAAINGTENAYTLLL
jgi:hypothetical protein